jgi:hypothetical protein
MQRYHGAYALSLAGQGRGVGPRIAHAGSARKGQTAKQDVTHRYAAFVATVL